MGTTLRTTHTHTQTHKDTMMVPHTNLWYHSQNTKLLFKILGHNFFSNFGSQFFLQNFCSQEKIRIFGTHIINFSTKKLGKKILVKFSTTTFSKKATHTHTHTHRNHLQKRQKRPKSRNADITHLTQMFDHGCRPSCKDFKARCYFSSIALVK